MPKPLPIDFVPNSGTPNTQPVIYNSLDSASLNVIAAGSPNQFLDVPASNGLLAKRVSVHSLSIAKQMNAGRSSVSPPMICDDLEENIIDIKIETAAQGSGILTVSLLDPGWELLRTQQNGTSFIDVDEFGYLWPPIEINFPEDVSDATWRLCSVKPSSDSTSANMVLVFEDKIVAELREHDQQTDPSCAVSRPNETRAEYIRRCVKTASKNPRNPTEVGIRFIPLLPTEVFTTADLTADQISLPSSAKGPNVSAARGNPGKKGAVPVLSTAGNVVKTVIDALNQIRIGDGFSGPDTTTGAPVPGSVRGLSGPQGTVH